MTVTHIAAPPTPFTDAEAPLIAQILNAQAVNQRWQYNSPHLTALLGSLRGRKILEKVPGRTASSKVSWRTCPVRVTV